MENELAPPSAEQVVSVESGDPLLHWLVYWLLVSLSSVAEALFSINEVVPLYWLEKVVFFLYLQWPPHDQAERLFQSLVSPLELHS